MRRAIKSRVIFLVAAYTLLVLPAAWAEDIATDWGSSSWAAGAAGLTTVNVRNMPPLADVRVVTTTSVKAANADKAQVMYFIGTVDKMGGFNEIARAGRMVTVADGALTFTNDFKDLGRGVEYTVKVNVTYFKNPMTFQGSSDFTDRKITP
jgi:ABC-type branched-subunit amino acid transport system substrate-binding protein